MPPELTGIFAGTSILVVISICGGLLLTTALTIGITVFALRFIRKTVGTDPTILQQGTLATAKIVSVQQTGVLLNHQPQVAFLLEVTPPGGVSYQAQVKAVIPMVHIPQYQPGAQVPVKIHPTDPSQVALVPGGVA